MATTVISASKSEVWQVLKNPGDIHKYHPLIKSSNMTTSAQRGIGAKRHCLLHPMGAMEEVIDEWIEGEQFTTRLIGGKMLPPLASMKGCIHLADKGSKTTATFTLSYQIKYGIVGKLIDFLFIRPQFKSAPKKYVVGLKAYVEQNTSISYGE